MSLDSATYNIKKGPVYFIASCANSTVVSLVASDVKLKRERESLTIDVRLNSEKHDQGKFERLKYVEFFDDELVSQLKSTYSSLQITAPIWTLRMRGEQISEFGGNVTWSPFGLRFTV
jgi:hypothetical protein